MKLAGMKLAGVRLAEVRLAAATFAARPIVLALSLASAAAAAQQLPRDEHRIREPYITATGATVDKPGEPQGSAPTPLDRRIQRQDNRIDGSICSGC